MYHAIDKPRSVAAIVVLWLCSMLGATYPAQGNLRACESGNHDVSEPSDEVIASTGILVGRVTSNSALIQVRLSRAVEKVEDGLPGADGIVEFVLEEVGSPSSVTTTVETDPERDYIARVAFDELLPNKVYRCTTRIGADVSSLRAGPSAEFRTLGGSDVTRPVSFVVVTGMNYAKFHGASGFDLKQHLEQNNTELPPPYDGPDKELGFPALETILKMEPDFFIGTGDNVYYDSPPKGRARTIEEMRDKWHMQFAQPRYHDLFAKVPTYWEIDDHDFRVDDSDLTGDYLPSPELGRRVMLEQLPYAAYDAEEPLTYGTYRVSRELQIWLTENRLYRSPNAMDDGPEKSIWGVEQREWLKRTLLESDAPFKILVSPTPMIGPDDLRKTDNHSDIGGFQHERDEFFNWLSENDLDEGRLLIVCGDRHWQYHSIHPDGFEEFSCGALVDANSRLGRNPGDPKSTDPDGLIKQPYTQKPASGGFLRIRIEPAGEREPNRLVFEYYDEHGELLHEHVKRAQ